MSAPEQQQEAAACPLQEQLWDYFVVIGLPKVGLQTVQGDAGFLGTDQRYKPAFVDSLPNSTFDESCRFPPQLPTCCLPAGIDIVLHQDLHKADLTPHTYTIVLTGGNGTQVYVSCLTFYDRVPSDLCAKHEDLLGAVALKALCLQSKRPYLNSSQQVLREIYRCAFQRGSTVPVPDLVNSLLTVPSPQQGSPKLCLRLCGSRHVVCPPLPIGPPPGEVSLQPLLEVMQPDSLVGLFAAVLLEQRVLLRSRHHWLLTVAAEGVVRLMYPLKYQHVYIPALPSTLVEYLEAPTPFLMGVHSAEPVDQRTLDSLVVADLDRGTLQLGKDDGLLRRCLNHPYMQRLQRRIRMLMQPSVTEADLVHISTAPQDPWVAAAQAMAGAPWSPSKQALLVRMFMEFFREVLQDYQQFLCTTSQEASERAATLARSNSRMTSGGGSSSGSTGGAAPGSRALRSVLSGAAGAAGSLAAARSNSLAAGSGAQLQAQIVGLQALFDHHYAICRYKDFALLQQVMGGLPFLSFVGEHTNTQPDPAAWLKAGEGALLAWRMAEEDLQAHPAPAGAAGAGASWVLRGRSDMQHSTAQEDGFDGTVLCIPDQPPSGLMPAAGLLHRSFPALVLSEYSERTQGGKRRKTAVNRQKRPSVGRRRAISELMGSPLDLRRKTPLPAGTNTDTSPPRLMRVNPLDTTSTAPQLTPPLAPGLQLPSLSKISNVSNSSTNASLSEEYSTEAELIGRQIGMLVHLMQVASAAEAAEAAKAAAASAGSDSSSGAALGAEAATVPGRSGSSSGVQGSGALASQSSQNGGGGGAAAVLRRYSSNGARSHKGQLSAEVLEAATQLLCIQTGGNGWFIVCRLKELLANPPPPCTDLEREAAAAQARPPSRADARGGAGSPVPAATAAGKAGGDVSPSSKPSSPQGKTMLGKSGKLLGVNLSSSSKATGLKVSHVDSFASAASVMASVITRNSSSSKQKHANGSSNAGRPTNTVDSTKASSAPSSTCGSAAPVSASAPAFNHSMSCRLDDRQHSKASTSGNAHAPHPSASNGSTSTAGGAGAVQAAADQAAGGGAQLAAGAGAKQQGAGSRLATAGQVQQAGDGVRVERRVPPEVFEVLSAMLNSILEVAAAQDDSRVVLTVLELASCIYCTTGATTRYMLATLSGNPNVRTEWFWSFTFAFAVSSSYLDADDFVNMKQVVCKCLLQFASYLAGVGIPGAAAWVLLMQMATEHLQIAHAGGLETSMQLTIRQQMVQARTHYCMEPPATAAEVSSSNSGNSKHKLQKQGSKQPAAVPPQVAAALQACGIILPSQLATAPSADASSSSSVWQSEQTPGSPRPRPAGAVQAAVTIPAPGTADSDQPASVGGSRVSVSSGVLGSAASDTESPVTVHRPMSPLNPAGMGTPDRASGSAATTPPSANTPLATPFGLSPRGGISSPKAGAAGAAAARKEGYGSYAKLLNRQATSSLSSGPSAAALVAAAAAADGLGAAAGVQDSEAGDATATPVLSVQGGCLADQGSMQWAAVHSKEVVAMAAQSHIAVSAGLDGYLKVLNLSGGGMRLAASMAIPSLQDPSAAAAAVASGALPVLQLWYDGQKAAVGNSRHQAVWIVDLTGAQASVELSGLGSSVSCLSPLYRNRDALLSGLTYGSVVCGAGSTSSSSQLATAYLWDLRKPRRPASSLNFTPELPSAALLADRGSSGAAQAGSGSSSAGTPGILCLTVHEDGALAAAGFRDGKVLTWDMRQGSTPLSECKGHTGPVKHISFLPRAASAAAGLGRTPLLLTGSEDWTARVWDAESGACRGACVGHGGGITAMQTVHSSAATRLVTGAADGSIGLWGLDGEMVSLVQQHGSPVMLLKQGGDTLVSGAADKGCHVWGLQGLLPSGGSSGSGSGLTTNAQLSRLLASQQTPAEVGAMAFDPMAELLCAGHRDGIVSVWNCSSYSTQCSTIYE